LVTGFVTQERVKTFLSAADVYVVGSLREGWSVAMLEALACGKPIVSTAVSGAADMVQEGCNGFVLPERDPVRFADAVLRSLTLPAAASCSLDIARRYSLETLGAQFAQMWDALA